jgi:hypothetical protein
LEAGLERFITIADDLAASHEDVHRTKMFGAPCIKVKGKAFAAFSQGRMVYKLRGDAHAEALALPGAALFDPSGQGHPMREWVTLPIAEADHWERLAEDALAYVSGLSSTAQPRR